jgi:hypothetical protein
MSLGVAVALDASVGLAVGILTWSMIIVAAGVIGI